MASRKRSDLAQSELIPDPPLACSNETAAAEFLEAKRWSDCPCCPECESVAVYKMMDSKTGMRNKRFLWRCRDCSKLYTVRANSVLSESLIPLSKWCRALWMAATAKNGVSARELSRTLQVNYRTALFVLHRLRHAMADTNPTPPKLEGTVECDPTDVGGKPRLRGTAENSINKRGRGTKKQPAFAIFERDGKTTGVGADQTEPFG